MRHEEKGSLTRAMVALTVLVAAGVMAGLGGGVAEAKKPPKPPPDPEPGLTNPAFVFHYDSELFVMKADGSESREIYSPGKKKQVRCPVWSPDGDRIAFLRITDPPAVWCELYTVKPDGTDLTLVRSFETTNPYPPATMDWSPDGSTLLYSGGGALWALDWATGAVQSLSMPGSEQPSFGPDLDTASGFQGMIAYTDQVDVFVIEVQTGSSGLLETVGTETRLDLSGWQREPRWSRDGRSIAFKDLDDGLRIVPVQSDADGWFEGFGTPWTLHSAGGGRTAWSPDSRHLVFRSVSRYLPGGGATVDLYRVTTGGVVTGPLTEGSDRDSSGHPDWNPAWTDDL